jgi:uncharacterized protein (DUF433 family)
VVGAYYESSNATGLNGDQGNNLAANSSAAYVFVRNGTNWSQQAYLKASNTGGGVPPSTIEPGKRGGKPCVRGMRIRVSDVLGWLAAGMSHQEIVEDHPELTEEDIRACLAYAADRERRAMTVVTSHEAPA